MIFKLSNGAICETKADFTFNELQFETLIVGNNYVHELNYKLFNDAFLYLGRQISNNNSFTTFYAVDTFGRGVMIELKKFEGKEGVGTHCLNSINLISTRKGEEFVNFCLGRKATEEEAYTIKQFITCDYNQINAETKVVMMARSFDRSVFNFGNWLASNNIQFKAVRYYSTKINGDTLIEFSPEFETWSKFGSFVQENRNLPLPMFNNRKSGVYFHDVGHADEKWWNFLQKANVITASYDNTESPLCRGYNLLHQYVPGDVVIAFAKDHGVLGFGTVTSKGYAYKNHDLNDFANSHYHTMSVQWEAVLPFTQAVPMKRVVEMGLNQPVQTKQEIRFNKGVIDGLLAEIKSSFNKRKVA